VIELERIFITQSTCFYLQRLEYEIANYKQLINWLFSHINMDRNDVWRDEKFAELNEKLQDSMLEKQIALDEIRKQYQTDEDKELNVKINFHTGEVTFV